VQLPVGGGAPPRIMEENAAWQGQATASGLAGASGGGYVVWCAGGERARVGGAADSVYFCFLE
jgi:hypothetical protein